MGKFTLVLGLLVCVGVTFVKSAECPSFTKVQKCSPICYNDTECSRKGGKCCPNICNTRSCAEPNTLLNESNMDKSNSVGPGVYCGNVKCSPFQKCGMDKLTKRPMCVPK